MLTARKVRPQFSANPSETEIFQSGAFVEPLVPVGSGKASVLENAALASATLSFVDRTISSDTSALSSFLDAHPDSSWRASILTNIGLRYRRTGYYSRALDSWEQAWNLAKNEKGALAHNLADRALGELLELNSRIGRQERLKTLLDEAGRRNVQGSVSTQIENAKAALWLMQNRPETSFKCGPYALWRILASQNNHSAANTDLIENFRSTAQGVSLSQVAELSHVLGMNYQMAKRQPGSAFIVPSVIHWKVGHYAAIVGKAGERYVLEDPTFGQPIQVEETALNAEASGYFVVPAGVLPSGWQSVAETEGNTVWGRGEVGGRDPDPTCPCDEQSGGDSTGGCAGCDEGPGPGPVNIAMPGYTVHTMPVSIHLTDSPVGYAPPLGPSIYTTVTYNQLEANQPTTPQYSNFGSLWTFNWLSYVTLDSGTGSGAHIYVRGGGTHNFPTANSTSGSGDAVTYPPNLYGQASLGKTTAGNYEQRMPNGSKEVFNLVDAAGRIFLRQVTDPQGNAVTLYYDADVYTDPQHLPAQPYRLHHITDALGQTTNFFYELTGDPYKITKVTDPFGRSAIFGYTQTAGVYQLTSITDVIGMTSSFTYTGGNFLHLLTTPYGTTTFVNTGVAANASTRALEITDPYGAKERWENWISSGNNMPSSDPDNVVPRGMYTRNTILYARSTYYWNKKAMLDDPSHPYTKAHNYHFLHHVGLTDESGIIESEKLALENRVWYNYPGQPYDSTSPPSLTESTFDQGATTQGTSNRQSVKGRVLGDGTTLYTQLTKYAYNAVGNVTKRVSPALTNNGGSMVPADGRTTFYDYDTATGMDLITMRQATGSSTSDVVQQWIYDPTYPAHSPKQIIDAAGRATSYEYTADGKIKKITNAKGEQTAYNYTRPDADAGPSDGYLYSITRPAPDQSAGSTTTYKYDPAGRLASITNPDQYKVSFGYDSLNRLLTTTYPDNNNSQVIYDRLDVEWTQDRLGRWTHYFHDDLRRLVAVEDPSGRTTNYGYCLCGALTSLTDPAGSITQWMQDLQSRPISTIYADGTIWTTTYENTTSRIQYTTDAKQQRTHYDYNVDDTLAKIRYTDTSDNTLVPATPTVAYTYDPVYPRLTQMDDGIGTTTYAYNPSLSASPNNGGRLASVDGPFTNDTIAYGYDELGRVSTQTINGGANTSTFGYDSLGRVHTVGNPLGTFTYAYVHNTGRLDNVVYPNGQITKYKYFGDSNDPVPSNDPRLREIQNLNGGNGVISQFDYTYTAGGNILTWQQSNPGLTHSQQYTFGYDGIDQLTSATLYDTVTGEVLRSQAYRYDAAMNRISVQDGANISTDSPNKLNQLTSTSGGGLMRFAGTVNKPVTLTVGGNAATVRADGSYEGWAQVNGTGTTRVHIVATDVGGSVTDKYTDVTPGTVAAQGFGYDLNGNQTAAGPNASQTTYGWDAANRLTSITQGGHTTRFDYDGQGRRVRESLDDSEVRHWIWAGLNLAEERSGGNSVNKQFFFQGERIAGQSYFYTRDHLDSVRELTDSSQVTRARYDYNLYGASIGNLVTSSPIDASFYFTGDFLHASSGLYLTKYRAYNASEGRWISRDPLGFKAGDLNLYRYVSNSLVNKSDPTGLMERAWYPGEHYDLPPMGPPEKCPCEKDGGSVELKYKAPPYNGDLDKCMSDEWRILRDGANGVSGGTIGTAVGGGLGGPPGALIGGGLGGLGGTVLIPYIHCTASTCVKNGVATPISEPWWGRTYSP